MVGTGTRSQAAEPAARRVVILGASNVTLGLSTIVDTVRHAWGAPLEMLVAAGHGRSYGLTTHVLGRGLPGITQCGLWDELERLPARPTAALLTDIGNDIIYGCSVGPVERWLDTCLARLAGQVDRLVVTRPPLEVIFAQPEWKLRLLTSLIFPSSRLNLSTALARAEELDELLPQYASRYGAYVVQPEARWYSWDPIHIARRQRRSAWQSYMSWWTDGRPPEPATRSLRRWYSMQRARPLRWTRFGYARSCQQPTRTLPDGTTISLF